MRNLYPGIDQRLETPFILLPAFYLIFALAACTTSFPARLSSLILLLSLGASSPYFRSKDLNEDYSRGLPSFALPIFFIDLLLISQAGNIRFVGPNRKWTTDNVSISDSNRDTLWSKFKWGFRLVCTFRGIGWSFQVKGVPQHHSCHSSRRDFVFNYLFLSGMSWGYTFGSQYLIVMATTIRGLGTSSMAHLVCGIIEGWSGALWAAAGLNQFYRLGAAISVAVGICDPWEWPPFFGSISDGWSVRQIWSLVWHQLLRQILQHPGIGLARSLGLRKGSLGSSYLQLYTAFTISMLLHAWCMFNATHSTAGELHFFLAQPLAITFEDLVQYCWHRSGFAKRYPRLAYITGYAWVLAWFSYCLPLFVKRQRAVG